MNSFATILKLDFNATFRSRWFWVYAVLVIASMGGIFATGISDSRVAGFTGLTRPLLIFIQGCNLVLPIFVLVSTVRTLVKEKESNIFEYELSFPISLGEYYFSKFLSRIVILCSPLLTAMVLSAVFCSVLGGSIPINIILLYSGLLLASTFFYVSLSFFISSLVRTQEVGLGVSLFIWLLLVALLDVALLGLLIKALVPEETIYTLVLLNPVQLFKIAAICLFDPVLSVIGPASYFILDKFGTSTFLSYTFLYLFGLGTVFLLVGFVFFSKRDLL